MLSVSLVNTTPHGRRHSGTVPRERAVGVVVDEALARFSGSLCLKGDLIADLAPPAQETESRAVVVSLIEIRGAEVLVIGSAGEHAI